MEVFQKLRLELLYDPAVSPLGVHLEKTIIQKDTCTPLFIATLLTVARTRKQPQCPLTEERIQGWCKYVHMMEYYSAIKMMR